MTTHTAKWVPWVTYGGTALVAGTTILVSGMWLTQLAHHIGIGGPLALSLPITVDAGGAVGTILWVTGPTDAARTWGRGVAVGALAASVGGNILAHLIGLGMLAVSWQLVVGVSALYPLMLWLMVHLLVLSRSRPTPTRKPAAKKPTGKAAKTGKAPAAATPASSTQPTQPAVVPAAAVEPVALHVVDPPATSKRDQAKAWFDQQVADGRDPADIKPAEVDRAIGASGYAKKFIATWRDDATDNPTGDQVAAH